MKELHEYTDQELDSERSRRSKIEYDKKREDQKVCKHDVSLQFYVEEDRDSVDGHQTGDLYFSMSEHCNKCYLDLNRYDILVPQSQWSKQEFKQGFVELCKKFGRAWVRK